MFVIYEIEKVYDRSNYNLIFAAVYGCEEDCC